VNRAAVHAEHVLAGAQRATAEHAQPGAGDGRVPKSGGIIDQRGRGWTHIVEGLVRVRWRRTR
jgi:hypothetical protein